MRVRAALLSAGLVVAGCGLKEPLEPPPGHALPPAPAAARTAPTAEQLLTPPPIARPERVGEITTRSEERSRDRFDLPPADVPEGCDTVEDEDDEDCEPE